MPRRVVENIKSLIEFLWVDHNNFNHFEEQAQQMIMKIKSITENELQYQAEQKQTPLNTHSPLKGNSKPKYS